MALVRVHYSDISKNSLSHYGVLGMKWGVRNEETLARYARDGIGTNLDLTGGGGYIEEPLDEEQLKEIEEHSELWQLQQGEHSADYDRNEVNPFGLDGYEEYAQIISGQKKDIDYTYASLNCATCSLVYDLRRRGFDVDANMTPAMAYAFQTELGVFYKGAELKNRNSLDEVIKDLKEMPDGARGCFAGSTINGGGHAIAWEKTDGRVGFHDAQTGQYITANNLKNHFKSEKKYGTEIIGYERLDDKKPNLKAFREYGLVSSKDRTTKDGDNKSTKKDMVKAYKGTAKMYKRLQEKEIENLNQTYEKAKKTKEYKTNSKEIDAEYNRVLNETKQNHAEVNQAIEKEMDDYIKRHRKDE